RGGAGGGRERGGRGRRGGLARRVPRRSGAGGRGRGSGEGGAALRLAPAVSTAEARGGDGGIGAFLITLARYFMPYRLAAGLLLGCLAIDLLFTTLWPLSFKFLIDDAIVGANRRVLVLTLGALLVGVVVA